MGKSSDKFVENIKTYLMFRNVLSENHAACGKIWYSRIVHG